MKTKISKIVTLVSLILTAMLIGFSVSAQSNPTVPAQVFINGRAAVTGYLLGQIDHVVIHYSGRSIVGNGWSDQSLDRNTLQQLGYVHNGQFTELSAAIYGRAYSGEVVKTPDGYYELNVQVTAYTADNKVVLQGSGYLPISEDSYGNLSVGTFQPYVDIPQNIDVTMPGYYSGAKWTGKNGKSLDFNSSFDGQNTTFTIPTGNLENGFLLFVNGNNGDITGWDLSNGTQLSGKAIYAVLGTTQSSAVWSLVNPTTIDSLGQQFFLSGNEIIGRYPLLDIVTSVQMTNDIQLSIPVWGATTGIAPVNAYVTPIYFNGNNNGMTVGQEYVLPTDSSGKGFLLNMPANCGFHLRFEFQGVSDWSEQSSYGNGGGGATVIGKG